MNDQSIARAPGSIANLSVGFDMLGLSFSTVFDTVRLEKSHPKKGIWIRSITGASGLPFDPYKNTCTR